MSEPIGPAEFIAQVHRTVDVDCHMSELDEEAEFWHILGWNQEKDDAFGRLLKRLQDINDGPPIFWPDERDWSYLVPSLEQMVDVAVPLAVDAPVAADEDDGTPCGPDASELLDDEELPKQRVLLGMTAHAWEQMLLAREHYEDHGCEWAEEMLVALAYRALDQWGFQNLS